MNICKQNFRVQLYINYSWIDELLNSIQACKFTKNWSHKFDINLDLYKLLIFINNIYHLTKFYYNHIRELSWLFSKWLWNLNFHIQNTVRNNLS